ncbi:MAG: lipase secretion chaperone [Alloalcanivorax venustensis]|jgi:hypothetical protein|uniref:lipase secretion chaperone n=1 Tax=Alloalcanivorax venustensis TaxID=172371 RepID=UPI002E8C52A7|nr:lipase secretion chaperone [Pseudomonadota bacterium]
MFDNKASAGPWILGAAVALAVLTGTLYWLGGEAPAPRVAEPPPSPADTAPDPVARAPVADLPAGGPDSGAGPARAADEPEPLPEQAVISEALSGLQWDGQGRLQVNARVREDLDALFMARGTRLDGQQFETLRRRITAGLPDDRARQVLDVVERYYHYSNVYRDLGDTFRYLGTEEEMSRGLRQLHNLRRDYLGADLAEALFGEEERMMRVTLENMRIQSDPALTEAQKRERQRPLSETPASADKR